MVHKIKVADWITCYKARKNAVLCFWKAVNSLLNHSITTFLSSAVMIGITCSLHTFVCYAKHAEQKVKSKQWTGLSKHKTRRYECSISAIV